MFLVSCDSFFGFVGIQKISKGAPRSSRVSRTRPKGATMASKESGMGGRERTAEKEERLEQQKVHEELHQWHVERAQPVPPEHVVEEEQARLREVKEAEEARI